MREFVLAFLCGLLIAISVRADDGARFAATKYRFGAHPEGGFERFVVAFQRHSGSGTPQATAELSGDGRSVQVNVKNLRLDGTFADASTLTKKFRHSGLFESAEADVTDSGLTLRIRFRTAVASTKTFFLESPDRLVVDAFGTNGLASLDSNRMPASRHGKRAAGGKKKKADYYCFAADSRLPVDEVLRRGLKNAAPDAPTGNDAVVCYPSAAQIVASVALPRERVVASEPPPSIAAHEIPAMPLNPIGSLDGHEPFVKGADGRRYWVAPYMPSPDRAAVKPLEAPQPQSAEPKLERGRSTHSAKITPPAAAAPTAPKESALAAPAPLSEEVSQGAKVATGKGPEVESDNDSAFVPLK